MAKGTSTLPSPPSELLPYLSKHPNTPTRELLQPYLAYELWLRKGFVRDHPKLNGLANLVSIYDGHESTFKIRAIDRETGDGEKYMMSLPDDKREHNDMPAIAASLEYRKNFEAFAHG